MDAREAAEIRRLLLEHYRRHRRELPWRSGPRAKDGYAIWVCEIMAQQTQIATVVRYWTRWMEKFPTVAALAAAREDDVLAAWAGLGYYARARSLHKAAKLVVAEHGGRVPDRAEALEALPGIGRYTAGAIASIAFSRRAAAVDGNVARVYARLFGIGDDVRAPATQRRLWELAEALVPARGPGDFNQALFDVGATVCTPRSPACPGCPLAARCVARATGRQAELPVVIRRTAVKTVDVEAALVEGPRGAWLMARRAPRGLYGGLWELPATAALPGGTRVDRRAALARHEHLLSHRRMRHVIHAARLPGGGGHDALPAPAPPYDAFRWVLVGEIGDLGVSSATRALVEALEAQATRAPGASNGNGEPRWPTRTRRSRTSTKASGRSSPG